MRKESDGENRGPGKRSSTAKPRGRRGGSRARSGGGARNRPTGTRQAGSESKGFEPDQEARRDILQEQLEAEFERPDDFGDPLDPEEASREDIAAELARTASGAEARPSEDDSRLEAVSEEAEFGISEGVNAVHQEEALSDADARDGPVDEIESFTEAAALDEAPEDSSAEIGETALAPREGEAFEVAEGAVAPAGLSGPVGDDSAEPAAAPAVAEKRGPDRLSRIWERLTQEGALRLEGLERQVQGGRGQERWLRATGKTQDGQEAAVVASGAVDSNLLIEGLQYLTELRSRKIAIRHLYLCAPYFENELRKAAYLVDPKKISLHLLRITSLEDPTTAFRAVETLRPETRDVNRDFREILAEVTSARARKLLERFKEVAEGALFESGGERVVCRGRKIYFRMKGEDLLVARPRDTAVLLEILFPRGRTLRLSEKNFSQTLLRIRECFESARKSQNLGSREGSFRLAVREALESREQGLIPLDTDVSVGPNRLKIDLLAARLDGTPVAIQIRTQLSLEDIQRGLVAFTALREQGTLLKRLLGDRGTLLNPSANAELCFASLRVNDAAKAITDLLVPRVTFLRVTPERRWWEGALKFEATGRLAARTAPSARPDAVPAERRGERRPRPRVERPAIKIEGKNPAVVLSHYHRDGIVANIVLSRAIPNVASRRFMSSEDLITFFFGPEVQATLPEVYDLYLTDLRFRPTTRLPPEAKEAFVESLRNHKGNICWVDHVYWQEFDRREIEGAIGKSNLVIAPRERTAALAVLKALPAKDEFSSKLVDLLYSKLSDDEYNAWGKGWLSVVDYLRNDLEGIEEAIKPLLEGRPEEVNPSLLEEGRRKEEEAETYVANRDFRVVIFGIYKMVIVDLPEKQTFNYTSVTQKARERYRAQLSLTCFGNSETIIIANSFTARQGLNMTLLRTHLTRRFEWLNAIQGHENVMTLKIEDLQANKDRLDQVLNEIVRNRSILS